MDPRHWLKAATGFFPFTAGVDIFFVISGFVILRAATPLFGRPGAAGVFLRRRLARICPLYWLMTSAFLAVWLTGGGIHGDIGGGAYILASYLFIPWPRPDGVMQPALGLGWTLNFEMFFYVAASCCLFLPRPRAVAALAAFLLLFVLVGRLHPFRNPQLGYWSNPIILEFAAGMGLALLPLRLYPRWRWLLFAAGLAGLHFGMAAAAAWRPLAYGAPAAALVAAAGLAPPLSAPSRPARLLLRLGDASYALYLVHPFIMRGLTVLWHKFHAQNEAAGLIYIMTGLAAAQICAFGLNLFVERKPPWLRRCGAEAKG